MPHCNDDLDALNNTVAPRRLHPLSIRCFQTCCNFPRSVNSDAVTQKRFALGYEHAKAVINEFAGRMLRYIKRNCIQADTSTKDLLKKPTHNEIRKRFERDSNSANQVGTAISSVRQP